MILAKYDDAKSILLRYCPRGDKTTTVTVYNIYGDQIYSFPLHQSLITKIVLPVPTEDYYIVKIGSEYVVLKPKDFPDEKMFILNPKQDTITIESDEYTVRKKIYMLFDNICWCDVSDLPAGKYVVWISDKPYGIEIRTPAFSGVI